MQYILCTADLRKSYRSGKQAVDAVRGVDMQVRQGETVRCYCKVVS